MKNQKGFISIPILIAIIVGVLVIGGGTYIGINKIKSQKNIPVSQENTTSLSPTTLAENTSIGTTTNSETSEVEKLKQEIEDLKNKKPPTSTTPSKIIPKDTKDHLDNDNDKLENWEEDLLGTDKNKSDSDGDTVPDGLDEHPLDSSSIINKIYQVKDDNSGISYPIRVNVPLDLYVMYKKKLRHDFENDASNISNYAIYKDKYVQDIISQVIIIAGEHKNVNWYQMFRNLVAQIVYNDDKFSGFDEYPKYPLESIVDGSGDCEDTSILLAALLRGFQYRWQTALKDSSVAHQLDNVNVGFLVMPGHVAVGYWVPDFEIVFDPTHKEFDGLNLAYYKSGEKKYCYVETTSNDFVPCEVPKQIDEASKSAKVYPLN